MATPANVAAFYSQSNWGNRFGIKGPFYGPNGHLGHDVRVPVTLEIPALRSGVVRRVQFSDIVGHTVAIESGPGDFSGYCHLYGISVSVGDTVVQGQIIASAAVLGQATGSAWDGEHLHLTRGINDRCAFGESVSDPAPLIVSILGGSTGGGIPGGGSNGIEISVSDGKILQNVAKRGGYTGPVDGAMGSNSWKGVQNLLASLGLYAGTVDGAPGTNTWKGVQRLAQRGGYGGPVDGFPGTQTYAGLSNWLAIPTSGPTVPPPAPTGMQGVYGIDVGTTQRDLNFQAIADAGYQFAIVKAGGSNLSPAYVAPFYQRQVARVRAAGLLVGHYWLVGSNSPLTDADYFLANMYDYRPGDMIALDNEEIDDGMFWTDAMCATFIQRVKSALGTAPFLYMNQSDLGSQSWTQSKALGAKLWITNPSGVPGQTTIGSAFPTWSIHQYSWLGNQDGIDIDLDVAKIEAFAGLTQPPSGVTGPPASAIPGGASEGGVVPVPTPTVAQAKILQALAAKGGYTGPRDGAMGANSWRGVQSILRDLGYYDGPADGIPGSRTYRGLQLLAQVGGYTGPVDGIPGANTYAGIEKYVADTSTGVPALGASDGVLLQRLGKAGGYVGAVDGAPGAATWRGVQQALYGYGYAGPVDGVMGSASWRALQRFAGKGGYTGAVDGVMGINSWKGVQTILRGFGYTGPIDGAPGTATYVALQRIARLGGYAGPKDGAMGSNSWRGVQTFLRGAGYTGPIDGAPGAATYRSLQTLASRGGYGGPIDGLPGMNTYAGLENLLAP